MRGNGARQDIYEPSQELFLHPRFLHTLHTLSKKILESLPFILLNVDAYQFDFQEYVTFCWSFGTSLCFFFEYFGVFPRLFTEYLQEILSLFKTINIPVLHILYAHCPTIRKRESSPALSNNLLLLLFVVVLLLLLLLVL